MHAAWLVSLWVFGWRPSGCSRSGRACTCCCRWRAAGCWAPSAGAGPRACSWSRARRWCARAPTAGSAIPTTRWSAPRCSCCRLAVGVGWASLVFGVLNLCRAVVAHPGGGPRVGRPRAAAQSAAGGRAPPSAAGVLSPLHTPGTCLLPTAPPDASGRGGIGRRAALRSLWGDPWKFESSRPHHPETHGPPTVGGPFASLAAAAAFAEEGRRRPVGVPARHTCSFTRASPAPPSTSPPASRGCAAAPRACPAGRVGPLATATAAPRARGVRR